jgi:hypothetical protein
VELWASAWQRNRDKKWIRTSGKNFVFLNESWMDVVYIGPKKAHRGMAQAYAGNGNPIPGI